MAEAWFRLRAARGVTPFHTCVLRAVPAAESPSNCERERERELIIPKQRREGVVAATWCERGARGVRARVRARGLAVRCGRQACTSACGEVRAYS